MFELLPEIFAFIFLGWLFSVWLLLKRSVKRKHKYPFLCILFF